MRRIYLIRHVMPDFPNGQRYCLGHTDMPIGTLGRLQGCLLGRDLGSMALTTFTSPLSRAVSTAEYISPAPVLMDGLKEMYAGEWDGLPFSEIKARWPETFSEREAQGELKIPDAEDSAAGQKRFVCAVRSALESSTGDIAIVAHATVNQYLICEALGLPLTEGRRYFLHYGSYSVLNFDGAFHLDKLDVIPHPELDEELCKKLLRQAGGKNELIEQCSAAAVKALDTQRALFPAGLALDEKLIFSAAFLQGFARCPDMSEEKVADMLDELGYSAQANIIRNRLAPDSAEINAICKKEKV